MNKWVTKKISDIGKVVGGATPSTKDEDNYGGDISWITPKDLASHQDRYILQGERSITPKGFDSCSAVMLPKGSILFSSRAPIGYVAIAAKDMCTNQGFKSIIPNEKIIDPLFLYYLLKANASSIASHGSGTTFPEISGKVMASIEVSFPESIVVQKRIASILDSLDSKIELNRKLNDNLEELFDSYCSAQMMSTSTSTSTYALSDLCSPKQWKTISASELTTSGAYPVYGAGGLIGHFDSYNHETRTIGTVCRGAGCGKMMMFEPNSYITGNVMCFDNISPIVGQPLLYYLLRKRGLGDIVSGSAQPQITGTALKSISLALPTVGTVKRITEFGEAIYNQIEHNKFETNKLSNLRDYLLPKLLNGEISLED